MTTNPSMPNNWEPAGQNDPHLLGKGFTEPRTIPAGWDVSEMLSPSWPSNNDHPEPLAQPGQVQAGGFEGELPGVEIPGLKFPELFTFPVIPE
jgi:hypothetical protein